MNENLCEARLMPRTEQRLQGQVSSSGPGNAHSQVRTLTSPSFSFVLACTSGSNGWLYTPDRTVRNRNKILQYVTRVTAEAREESTEAVERKPH